MMAETFKLFSLNPFSTGAGCNGQTIPYEYGGLNVED
jgi:hypothetical protein